MNIISTKNFSEKFTIFVVFLICAIILFLSVRGNLGNPTTEDLKSFEWKDIGPFESSNDRGRFALTYSFIENETVHFDTELAKFAAPDLAITSDGKYASLFAPGVSFMVMPGYLIGKYFGISQVGSFIIVVFFALLNFILIYLISIKLGVNKIAAIIAGLSFIFATPAFTYAVSLSQHHFSVFLILMALFLVIRKISWWSLSLVWLICAFSIIVDNPNLFFLFPIGLYALGKIIIIKYEENLIKTKIRGFYLLTLLFMIFPICLFGYFNYVSNGSLFKLSGSLKRVLVVEENNGDEVRKAEAFAGVQIDKDGKPVNDLSEKDVVGFFETRNILRGLLVHFTSKDRGTFWYAPIVLFGFWGLLILFQSKPRIVNLMVAVIGFNIIIYSMWGDPWGGWSFGSRYLIPSYALLSIGIGFFLTKFKKNIILLIAFSIIFIYSVRVNSLGALGTSSIPPQSEVLALEKVTGQVQKYDFNRSYDYLIEKGSKSFVYKNYFSGHISAYNYYNIISGTIILIGVGLTIYLSYISFKKI